MKYIEFLNQTTEESVKEQNVLVNETAELNLKSAALQVKKQISQLKSDLLYAESSRDFNPETIYTINNKLLVAKNKLKFFLLKEKELF